MAKSTKRKIRKASKRELLSPATLSSNKIFSISVKSIFCPDIVFGFAIGKVCNPAISPRILRDSESGALWQGFYTFDIINISATLAKL